MAILDSGFRDYQQFLGGALPDSVRTQSFRVDGDLEANDSQHGILCGEIVHAIAPQAELLFANWEPDCPESFLRAVRWARAAGARIVSCSVVMPGWSDGEGGGDVHAELEPLLDEMVFFASAGNLAQRHWVGDFKDGGKGIHEWRRGVLDNVLTPWGERSVSVEWSTPCGDESQYVLELRDADTGFRVGTRLPLPASGINGEAVRFRPEADHAYQLRLRLKSGPGGPVRVMVLGSALEHGTPLGSIAFPGDGRLVMAVGAVSADGRRADYSSCGPNSPSPKPELVAPVPFPSSCRKEPFTGTSAAAPQAAGLAALWWATNPQREAEDVRAYLCAHTQDLLRPGHDWETGYGLVRLPDVRE